MLLLLLLLVVVVVWFGWDKAPLSPVVHESLSPQYMNECL